MGQSFNDESQIEQQQAQEMSEIGGLVEGGVTGALTFGAGAAGGKGIGGGLKALAGGGFN